MQMTIENGQLRGAEQWASPNFGDRPAGTQIDLVVVHSISLPPGEYGGDAIPRFFCNQLSRDEHPYYSEIADLTVSAHLLIRRTGDILQFVNFDSRAWHAGRSSYEDRDECNDYSIGIELEGTDEDVFEDVQYDALVAVITALVDAYPALGISRVVGHSDIAPGRKTDPGSGFDWQRVRLALERVRSSHSASA